MDLNEARDLVNGPMWPKVRDAFLATGTFQVYPKGDLRRLEYLDDATRHQIELWKEALAHVAEWRSVVDGETVRKLKADYPGVYPEILRYAAYFTPGKDVMMTLLKLKFPEAYELCCS